MLHLPRLWPTYMLMHMLQRAATSAGPIQISEYESFASPICYRVIKLFALNQYHINIPRNAAVVVVVVVVVAGVVVVVEVVEVVVVMLLLCIPTSRGSRGGRRSRTGKTDVGNNSSNQPRQHGQNHLSLSQIAGELWLKVRNDQIPPLGKARSLGKLQRDV